jgi:hypothetical protein
MNLKKITCSKFELNYEKKKSQKAESLFEL